MRGSALASWWWWYPAQSSAGARAPCCVQQHPCVHRITEWLGLERTCGGHLVPPCQQGHLQQAALEHVSKERDFTASGHRVPHLPGDAFQDYFSLGLASVCVCSARGWDPVPAACSRQVKDVC